MGLYRYIKALSHHLWTSLNFYIIFFRFNFIYALTVSVLLILVRKRKIAREGRKNTIYQEKIKIKRYLVNYWCIICALSVSLVHFLVFFLLVYVHLLHAAYALVKLVKYLIDVVKTPITILKVNDSTPTLTIVLHCFISFLVFSGNPSSFWFGRFLFLHPMGACFLELYLSFHISICFWPCTYITSYFSIKASSLCSCFGVGFLVNETLLYLCLEGPGYLIFT